MARRSHLFGVHASDTQPVSTGLADVHAARQRLVESCQGSSVCSSHRPPAGSVPYDAHLENTNRIRRSPDTFSLSGDHAPRARASRAASTPTTTKAGWAKLGEVLKPASWRRPPAPAKSATDSRQAVVRHTGAGRMIDVIA